MSGEKAVWTNAEIDTFLDYLIDENAYKILDSKRQKNQELYDKVSGLMKANNGFDKTPNQCRTKFKLMKARYYKMLKE